MKKYIRYVYQIAQNIGRGINKTVFKNRYKNIFDLIQPNIFGVRKEGFGKEGDGTYVLPVDLIEDNRNYTLLSFGISNDISFEKDFIEKYPNIDVYAFDPTINNLPERNEKIKFFKIGLAGRNVHHKSLFTLQEIILKLDLDKKSKYILKIDIEGWEWEFLSEVNLEMFDIPIMAIELHFSPFPRSWKHKLPYTFYKNKYTILKKLFSHYYIHHIHANNDHYTKFQRFFFPTFLELTLIRKSLYHNEILNDIGRLHRKPNKTNKADIQYPFNKR